MKKNILFLSAALMLLMTGACSVFNGKNSDNANSMDNIYNKTWKLIELNGAPVADKVNGKEPFIYLNSESGQYSASGGCNGIGGEFTVRKNHIHFSQGLSTMMACDDMTVENGLKSILGKDVQYEWAKEGDIATLILRDKKTIVAKLTTNMSASAAQLDGTWELEFISGPRIMFDALYPDKKPTLQFDLAKGIVYGNSSCNNYSAALKMDKKQVSIDAIAATKMACEHMQGESTYFTTLEQINGWAINGEKLELLKNDVVLMRFKKK